MRGGAPWLAGVAVAVAALIAAAIGVGGCRRSVPADGKPAVTIASALQPAHPSVGPATLTLTLGGPPADILDRATVRVVGHMTHPGMTPAVATISPRGHGIYDAAVTFSMPGDWVLLVTVVLPDGSRFDTRVPVPDIPARQP